MASAFSTSYDEMRVLIAATLGATYTELNNPYFVEDDADIMLAKGWTLGIADASNTNRTICNKITVARDLFITMTKRYYAPSRDITARVTAEKELIDDQVNLLKALVVYTTDSIVKIDYNLDSGINFLAGDRFGILQLDTTVSLEYFESY